MELARQRYGKLSSGRTNFLDVALECAKLTIPTILVDEEGATNYSNITTPLAPTDCHGVVNRV